MFDLLLLFVHSQRNKPLFPCCMNHKMKEAFLDVLLYLFEYYSEESDLSKSNETQIRNELAQAGFKQDAIEHAMDWVSIFKKPPNKVDIETPKKHSFRILSNNETTLVNEECQNYITRLERFGLLPPLKRELLIDKLTGIGFEPLDVEVVKALSILMLFQEPNIDVRLNTIEGDTFWESPSKLN